MSIESLRIIYLKQKNFHIQVFPVWYQEDGYTGFKVTFRSLIKDHTAVLNIISNSIDSFKNNVVIFDPSNVLVIKHVEASEFNNRRG